MSGSGMGMEIGGMAEEDISGYIAAALAGQARNQGIGAAEQNVQQGWSSAQGYMQPYYSGGMQDYTTLRNMVSNGGYNTNPTQFQRGQEGQYGQYQGSEQPGNTQYNDPGFQFGHQQFQADPGYQFALQQGQNAIQGSAASQGGMLSGATMRALDKYSQGTAAQQYGQAYNRARGEYESNRAAGMANAQQNYNQYNTNRNFGYNQYADTRNFGRNQYLQNNLMDQSSAQQYQTNQLNEMNNRYGRQAGLATVGVNTGNTLGSMAYGYGTDLGNLNLARGASKSQTYNQLGQVANQQGQHMEQIGGQMNGGGGGYGSFGGSGGGQ
jgi:hypothetical protein